MNSKTIKSKKGIKPHKKKKVPQTKREGLLAKKYSVLHHITYQPEWTVALSSRGWHQIATAAQAMNPTPTNIQFITNMITALTYERDKKQSLLYNVSNH